MLTMAVRTSTITGEQRHPKKNASPRTSDSDYRGSESITKHGEEV